LNQISRDAAISESQKTPAKITAFALISRIFLLAKKAGKSMTPSHRTSKVETSEAKTGLSQNKQPLEVNSGTNYFKAKHWP